MTDPRIAALATDDDIALVDSLDAAWVAAEAVLPEGWWLDLRHNDRWEGHPDFDYMASATTEDPDQEEVESADTPAAALRALAARLREAARAALDAKEVTDAGAYERAVESLRFVSREMELADIPATDLVMATAAVNAMRDEIARLRKALTEIVALQAGGHSGIFIARAALAEGSE